MDSDCQPGFIYALSNKHLTCIKIGRTINQPERRVERLSASPSIPGKFKIVYAVYVPDVITAETQVHRKFKTKCVGKEYFDISEDEAKEALNSIPDSISYEEYNRRVWKRANQALENRRSPGLRDRESGDI